VFEEEMGFPLTVPQFFGFCLAAATQGDDFDPCWVFHGAHMLHHIIQHDGGHL
jgi:hypothetical protein